MLNVSSPTRSSENSTIVEDGEVDDGSVAGSKKIDCCLVTPHTSSCLEWACLLAHWPGRLMMRTLSLEVDLLTFFQKLDVVAAPLTRILKMSVPTRPSENSISTGVVSSRQWDWWWWWSNWAIQQKSLFKKMTLFHDREFLVMMALCRKKYKVIVLLEYHNLCWFINTKELDLPTKFKNPTKLKFSTEAGAQGDR